MLLPVMRPVAVVVAGLGVVLGAQAATYAVPPGVVKLQATIKGAGGGAGGADLNGAAGKGASGAEVVVEFDVQAGQTATYETGVGGSSGQSWAKGASLAGMPGGTGGAGEGAGGNGGDAPLSNFGSPWTASAPDPDSGSGAGGGGGGASSVTVNGLWARAGGGGGGGGGSWNQTTGVDAVASSAAPVATADCATAAPGAVGEFGTGTRAGHANTGGGGGGGGGGGYLNQAGTAGVAGYDGSAPATGGGPGGSCFSPSVRLISSNPAGGGAGTTSGVPTSSDGTTVPPVAGAATNGSVSFVPVMDKSIATATAGDSVVTLGSTLPASVPDPSVVTGYEFSCSPALGGANPLLVTKVPTAALPATNGTTYTCTVTVSVKDPAGGPDLKLLVSDPVTATPSATPVVVPPPVAGATPVPGLGGAGVVLLTGLLAGMGLYRRRRGES